MSSISITKVPKCLSNNYQFCDDYEKAMNMSFITVYNVKEFTEYKTERQLLNGNISVIISNPEDMPWNLKSNGFDIWPHIIAIDLEFVAVFWPKNYEIIFIINNWDFRHSAIAYNSITEKNWWKFNILFDGLFHLNDTIYAVGNRSIIFYLNVDNHGNRTFIMTVSF